MCPQLLQPLEKYDHVEAPQTSEECFRPLCSLRALILKPSWPCRHELPRVTRSHQAPGAPKSYEEPSEASTHQEPPRPTREPSPPEAPPGVTWSCQKPQGATRSHQEPPRHSSTKSYFRNCGKTACSCKPQAKTSVKLHVPAGPVLKLQ